jgi:hypothetical protein
MRIENPELPFFSHSAVPDILFFDDFPHGPRARSTPHQYVHKLLIISMYV